MDSPGKVLTAEDIVIVSVIALGFLGSIVITMFALSVPSVIVAILLGAAVAALVYRFLGGISPQTSFKLGALKISGTMAALVGCAYFINIELEKQLMPTMDSLFSPNFNEWFIVKKTTAEPIAVEVNRVGTISIPDLTDLENNRLSATKETDGLKINLTEDFSIGTLRAKELVRLGFSNDLGQELDNFVVTRRLGPGTSNYELNSLKLKLSTKKYSQDYSHYILSNDAGEQLHEGSIRRKGTEIIKVENKFYMIAVVEVDHGAQNNTPYAKFAIGELRPGINF